MDINTSNLIKYYTIVILGVLTPELLKKGYVYDKENPTKGFCYIASESAYYLFAKRIEKLIEPIVPTSYSIWKELKK